MQCNLVKKDKGSWICIAPHCEKLASEALRHGSHSFFMLQLHHICLYIVKHSPDGATTDSDNRRLTAAYYSIFDARGWKAELAGLQRTVYPYKWLPISCRSSAGQWKFAGQRPTFYHWATPPTWYWPNGNDVYSAARKAIAGLAESNGIVYCNVYD